MTTDSERMRAHQWQALRVWFGDGQTGSGTMIHSSECLAKMDALEREPVPCPACDPNALIHQAIEQHPQLSAAEKRDLHRAIEIGERWGFGNLHAWVATAFAVRLRDDYGVEEEAAIASMRERGPYPLPPVRPRLRS